MRNHFSNNPMPQYVATRRWLNPITATNTTASAVTSTVTYTAKSIAKSFAITAAVSLGLSACNLDFIKATQQEEPPPKLSSEEVELSENDEVLAGESNQDARTYGRWTPVNTDPNAEKAPCPEDDTADDETSYRRPGQAPVLSYEDDNCNPEGISEPDLVATNDAVSNDYLVNDRWKLVKDIGYEEKLFNPYRGFNILKGDRPVHDDWFFNAILVSDSTIEPANFPKPVGNATTERSNSIDIFGEGDQVLYAQQLIAELVYYKGNTVFKPPDYEFRLTPVFNYNEVHVEERGILRADPDEGTTRYDHHLGIQAAFFDYHIRNVSSRYDFDSFRIGIQPFSSDFRGFLFQDNQLGIRLFGTRSNNRFQYNLGWFRRLEKDTNSGLNRVDEIRKDDVFVANVYWQDMPTLGFFSQLTFLYNRNREGDEVKFDDNDFIARPASIGTERSREYDVYYLGYNGDGHFGRLNLTASAYLAFGEERNSTFTNKKSDILSYFVAAEAGFDFDWARTRFSFLHTKGDDDPFDDESQGFDAVFENPIFAGYDTSFFIRQNVPLIAGGRVALSTRNGVLINLRSSKELGQSNFVNPGITLLGAGTDLDLTPEWRLSFNANQIWFSDTTVLEVARNQEEVANNFGLDISTAAIYRPFANQQFIVRLSAAAIIPGQGYEDLFEDDELAYSVLANIILAY